MSAHITVQSEIRNMRILKDTLTEMGYNFADTGSNQEVVEIQRSYHNIRFSTNDGQVSFDDANTKEVNTIKRTYSVNFCKDFAIKEGMEAKVTEEANGEVTVNFVHP
jgi:hypothetical protein